MRVPGQAHGNLEIVSAGGDEVGIAAVLQPARRPGASSHQESWAHRHLDWIVLQTARADRPIRALAPPAQIQPSDRIGYLVAQSSKASVHYLCYLVLFVLTRTGHFAFAEIRFPKTSERSTSRCPKQGARAHLQSPNNKFALHHRTALKYRDTLASN